MCADIAANSLVQVVSKGAFAPLFAPHSEEALPAGMASGRC